VVLLQSVFSSSALPITSHWRPPTHLPTAAEFRSVVFIVVAGGAVVQTVGQLTRVFNGHHPCPVEVSKRLSYPGNILLKEDKSKCGYNEPLRMHTP
jgi:hypothetical protein